MDEWMDPLFPSSWIPRHRTSSPDIGWRCLEPFHDGPSTGRMALWTIGLDLLEGSPQEAVRLPPQCDSIGGSQGILRPYGDQSGLQHPAGQPSYNCSSFDSL